MSTDPLMGEIAGPGSGPPLTGPGVTAPSLSGAGRRFLSDILVELGLRVPGAGGAGGRGGAQPRPARPRRCCSRAELITEDKLARALAERYGLDHIDLTEFPVDTSAAALLRKTAAKRYMAAPVGFAEDGALVLAVSDPADSLGLSDIAVMTKLPVRPAVAARSQIAKLVDTLSFMVEPTQGTSESVSTVIIPPDGDAHDDAPAAPEQAETSAPTPSAGGADERELSRLREELAMALVERDEAKAKLERHGEQTATQHERELEDALSALKLEHERALAAAEATSEEALRAERTSAQQALSSLRAKQDEALAAERAKFEEALDAERAKRVDEVEAERARTVEAIDAERERHAKELEALRARLTRSWRRLVRTPLSRPMKSDEGREASAQARRGARPARAHRGRGPACRGRPGRPRGSPRGERAAGPAPCAHRAGAARGAGPGARRAGAAAAPRSSARSEPAQTTGE